MAVAILEVMSSGLGVIGLLAVVLCACAVTYLAMRRSVQRELDEVRGQIAEMAGMRSAVEELAKAKAIAVTAAAKPAPVVEMPKAVAKPEAPKPMPAPPRPQPDELAHETLVVIAAAVAAFLGKSVRLRSARLIQPVGESPWAQQGRVYIQASHNLARV